MNLSILDGRAELWQWDTGIRLVMDEACEAVNISASTFGVSVDVTAAEDGKTWVAAVPDEMLQVPGDLICYAVQTTDTGTITAAYRSFRINRRPKPYGYVATPTEARTWQELDDKKIDAPQVAQAGEVLTVEEVDEDGKPKKWKTAPGVRGEKGDTGPAGPKGADGKDGAGMDVTGAKVGQIAKITAVDSAGKPTEWEPVDMPSGGTYTLPIASPTVLGGVKPIAKTDAMTQGVGVDAEGALWTAAMGGAYKLLVNQTLEEAAAVNIPMTEEAAECNEYIIYIVSPAGESYVSYNAYTIVAENERLVNNIRIVDTTYGTVHVYHIIKISTDHIWANVYSAHTATRTPEMEITPLMAWSNQARSYRIRNTPGVLYKSNVELLKGTIILILGR